MPLLVVVAALLGAPGPARRRSPVLGWSTWCTQSRCGDDWCSSAEVLSVASSMQEGGALAMGFDHILLDDCWGVRDQKSRRIEADRQRFPEGMEALVGKVHALGFKVGVYTDMGEDGCHSPFTGSWPYYEQDARDFAAWGVDYVKFDYCAPPPGHAPADLTRNMSHALKATERAMHFHFHCNELTFEDARCGAYGDSFRIAPDHIDAWYSTVKMSKRLGRRKPWWGDGANRGWPDPDFVYPGGQGCGPEGPAGQRCPGQSEAEYLSEWSVWAIGGGQLVFATDPRNLSAVQRKVLFNEEVLRVFRDTSGFADIRQILRVPTLASAASATARSHGAACTVTLEQQLSHGKLCTFGKTFGCASADVMWVAPGCRGTFVCNGVPHVDCESLPGRSNRTLCSCAPEPPQIWTRPLDDGGAAIVFFNAGEAAANLTVRFDEIAGRQWGETTQLAVRDLWAHEEVGSRTGAISMMVDAHASAFLRAQPLPVIDSGRLATVSSE